MTPPIAMGSRGAFARGVPMKGLDEMTAPAKRWSSRGEAPASRTSLLG
jgi:hypothetical protein